MSSKKKSSGKKKLQATYAKVITVKISVISLVISGVYTIAYIYKSFFYKDKIVKNNPTQIEKIKSNYKENHNTIILTDIMLQDGKMTNNEITGIVPHGGRIKIKRSNEGIYISSNDQY